MAPHILVVEFVESNQLIIQGKIHLMQQSFAFSCQEVHEMDTTQMSEC